MAQIIDRRLNGRNKSAVNRQRFLRRYKSHIRKAVTDMVGERSITDMDKEGQVSIPSKDISEPRFTTNRDGDREYVLPGNDRYMPGDVIPRPQGGSGGRGSQGGSGEAEDAFAFTLTREEFMNIFFDDLELPNLLRKELGSVREKRFKRAGYTRQGTPSSLALLRTIKTALARRIALQGSYAEAIETLNAELDTALAVQAIQKAARIRGDIARLEEAAAGVPFIDEIDLRYRNLLTENVPMAQAVMFCLMDVSASMDEAKKDLAKRFFTLLYLFLTRKYEKVEVVFIRHTENAEEVDEQSFFHDRKSGGTVVLSALQLMKNTIDARYPLSAWNIYGAQVSDGDAFGSDPFESAAFLKEHLMPAASYFAYVEVPDQHEIRPLWTAYESLAAGNFAMRRVTGPSDIYPVLRSLFEKKTGPR